MEYKPLNMFVKQTDELKKLIAEHPDYPIVVIVAYEVCGDDSYGWRYAPELRFSIGEILDCEQDVNDARIYVDRDEFEEDLRDYLCDDYENLSDEEFDKVVQNKMKEYEPYWKNVIQIRADV